MNSSKSLLVTYLGVNWNGAELVQACWVSHCSMQGQGQGQRQAVSENKLGTALALAAQDVDGTAVSTGHIIMRRNRWQRVRRPLTNATSCATYVS